MNILLNLNFICCLYHTKDILSKNLQNLPGLRNHSRDLFRIGFLIPPKICTPNTCHFLCYLCTTPHNKPLPWVVLGPCIGWMLVKKKLSQKMYNLIVSNAKSKHYSTDVIGWGIQPLSQPSGIYNVAHQHFAHFVISFCWVMQSQDNGWC